ncbi:MAG: hypothetical protein ACH36H_13115, partial [Candidatus Nanopelagicales bacterium]
MRRLTAAAVVIAVTLVGCSTPAAAQTAPPAPAPVVSHVDRVCSPVEFPYRPADVQRWWNCHRDPNIDRADAGRLAWWLNAVVLNRIAAYLAAVDAARTTACSGPGDCPALVRAAFARMGVGYRGDEAVRVMMCESGGNPRATNGSHDGLFQQADAYWSGRSAQYGMAGRSAYDPWANAIVSAGMVRDTGGWSHWSCRP